MPGIALGRREFYEAEQWFRGSQAEGPFAFENVCHILDLDPNHLRRTLRDWTRAGYSRPLVHLNRGNFLSPGESHSVKALISAR